VKRKHGFAVVLPCSPAAVMVSQLSCKKDAGILTAVVEEQLQLRAQDGGWYCHNTILAHFHTSQSGPVRSMMLELPLVQDVKLEADEMSSAPHSTLPVLHVHCLLHSYTWRRQRQHRLQRPR
jgi:hypothetical protein